MAKSPGSRWTSLSQNRTMRRQRNFAMLLSKHYRAPLVNAIHVSSIGSHGSGSVLSNVPEPSDRAAAALFRDRIGLQNRKTMLLGALGGSACRLLFQMADRSDPGFG